MLAIGQNLSMAFHPQTNRLLECKNQWIEQYLCTVMGGQPEDWNKWLPIATTVYNNRTSTTLKMSPSKVLISCQIRLLPNLIIHLQNPTVEERITSMKEQRSQVIQALNQAANALPPPQSRYKCGD